MLILLPLIISLSEIFAIQTNYGTFSDTVSLYSGCSIVTISKGTSVYFGGNDDYINPDSYYWVEPGDTNRYGVIWIGTPDNPQQGVNEKGLAYDANGLPRYDMNPHPERIPVPGGYHMFCMGIMHECATVKEVIDWASTHQHFPYMHDQMHFADATGDAVIISAGEDGEMVFTRKPTGDGFLVSTNFNVANFPNNYGYPCWRYEKASGVLRDLFEKDDLLGIEDVTAVLDGVHMEKGSSWTIETMVADLVQGVVYVYYFYQYDRPVILNVRNELSNPREPGPLSRLFPDDVQREAASRYNKARVNLRINWIAGLSWIAILLSSLIVFLNKRKLFGGGFWFWITAVFFLGPVALVSGLIALRKCKSSICRDSVIETLGNLVPLVVAYTLAVAILIISMVSGGIAWHYQLVLIFGLPIIMGLIFHTVFLGPFSQEPAGRFLLKSLPRVLVSVLTGIGGITPLALPVVNKSLYMSLLIPLSPLPVLTWWSIVVLSSIPGGLLIFLFQRWSVKNGFRSWAIIYSGEGEMSFPGWGRLLGWILISTGILITGLLIGVLLAR